MVQNPSWKVLLADFSECQYYETEIKDQYLELLQQLDRLDVSDTKGYCQIIDNVIAMVENSGQSWYDQVRDGAFSLMEQKLIDFMTGPLTVELSCDNMGRQSSSAQCVLHIAKFVDPASVKVQWKPLVAKAVAVQKKADQTIASQALYDAATTWTNSSQGVENLQLNLDRAKNAKLSDDLALALVDLRKFLFKAVEEISPAQVASG
eukprot:6414446-Pyramimonas_sp.AAC.1